MNIIKTRKQDEQPDSFENLVLDKYEEELSDSFAKNEWESADNAEELKIMWREAARRYKLLNESKKVTIRINQGDLIKLKARAERTNIPYQTLLNVLIRDYVDGKYSLKL